MEGRSSLGIVGVGDVDAKRYVCFPTATTVCICGIIALEEEVIGVLATTVVNALFTGPYNCASTTLDGKTLWVRRDCPACTLRRARMWRAQPIYHGFMELRGGGLFCV